MSYQLKFERRFSMAHRLISDMSPKCAIPHGHNEFVRVYLEMLDVKPLDNDTNMLVSFDHAKTTWHKFIDDALDHSFQVRRDDPILHFFKKHEPHLLKRIMTTPGDPTTEFTASALMSKLQHFLDSTCSKLQCTKLELEETPTNTVIIEGFKSFKLHLPDGDYWWNRADMSINDF